MRFPVVIHKDEDSSYGVSVPDLPGCISANDTVDGAFTSVREAILLHLDGMLAHGYPLPTPQPIQQHLGNPAYVDGIWGYVDVDLTEIPDTVVRVDITAPSKTLATIDQWANWAGETRSGFMLKATLEYISSQDFD